MSRGNISFSGVGNYNNGSFEGVGSFGPGSYEELKIDGVATINGDLQAVKLDVDGVATIKGDIEAGSMDADGVLTVKGSVRANELSCNGVVEISQNLRAAKLSIDGVVDVKGDKVESDEIVCNGALRARGEISADRVIADGFISAREIVGECIEILSIKRNIVVKLLNKLRDAVGYPDFSRIELIEATTVRLRGVKARQVNGQDIYIEENCEIERIDCSGTLVVDPSSKVTETL